jgi:hypothetical protein
MPVQPRGRACQNCQSIKIKCELGAPGGGPPPCQRCTRLSKTCILAPPKRQKDRVAELEAKVAELTRLLDAQGLQNTVLEAGDVPGSGTGSEEQSDTEIPVSSQKKRKLEVSAYSSNGPSSTEGPSPASSGGDTNYVNSPANRLDALVPPDLQQRVLDEYITSYQPLLMISPLSSGTQASLLRTTMPNTLHAIVYIASCGILSWDLQDLINVSLIEDLTSRTIAQCEKSVDLLQALQIVCLYYRSPRNSTQIPLFQLVNIEADMAVDLGFGGNQNPPSLSIVGMAEGLLGGVKASRLWLTSFLITQATALLRRKSNEQKWTFHHDQCLQTIETDTVDSGLLGLAQQARAAQLLATISEDMDLNTNLISPIVGTASCQRTMGQLQSQVTDWRLQVPIDLWSPTLTFTGFYMELLLYEPVLHTPTNKATFAAPFLIERLSTADVPTPPLTRHHFDAVQSLKTACHNLIDSATTFTGPELIALPTLLYAPRIAQAAQTLLRLHVAITVSGNTYGQILRSEELQTMDYLEKCLGIVSRTAVIDSEAVIVRIVKYANELKKWMQQYETSRLAIGNSGHGHAEFHAKYGEKGQVLGSGYSTSVQAGAQLTRGGLETSVDFAEFLDPDFVMDDFGLFDLFSEEDLSSSAAFGGH